MDIARKPTAYLSLPIFYGLLCPGSLRPSRHLGDAHLALSCFLRVFRSRVLVPVLVLAGAMDEVGLVRKGRKRCSPVEGKDGSKFHALLQDYNDLLKETEAKKKRLETIDRSKLRLLAEIKFLKRKYKLFAKSSSGQTHYRLKKQDHPMLSLAESNEDSSSDKHGAAAEVANQCISTNLDLNQGSLLNDEQTDFQMHQDHPEINIFDQAGFDEGKMANNVSLTVCRDVGCTSKSVDKRTIIWQDQVALKV